MTIQIALFLLTICAALTSLITEAVKKTISDKRPTITAAIVAVLVGAGVPIGYLIINKLPITTQDIVYIIAMAVMTWVSACVGYDKTKEFIEQFIIKSSKPDAVEEKTEDGGSAE